MSFRLSSDIAVSRPRAPPDQVFSFVSFWPLETDILARCTWTWTWVLEPPPHAIGGGYQVKYGEVSCCINGIRQVPVEGGDGLVVTQSSQLARER